MYILKKHYEATETNQNFAGEKFDHYSGRAESMLSDNGYPSEQMINEYGYKTLSGAKRGLKSAQELCKWENELGHWHVTVELIEA